MGTSLNVHCVVCGNTLGRSHQRSRLTQEFVCDSCGNLFAVDWGDNNAHGKYPVEISISKDTITKTTFFSEEVGHQYCVYCGNVLEISQYDELLRCPKESCSREYVVEVS